MCGGRSALIVVCAGDVVIFLTGLLLLRLQRPFRRAVQVSVKWRVLCEACVCVLPALDAGWEGRALGTL